MNENQKDIQTISELLRDNLTLLREYDKLTDQMISADLTTVQKVLLDRQNLLERIDENRSEISTLLSAQSDPTRAIITSILRNEQIDTTSLTGELREMLLHQRGMRNIWGSIQRKDQSVHTQINTQLDSIRKEMVAAQNDRKLIDYYNTVSVAKKTGKTLDSST